MNMKARMSAGSGSESSTNLKRVKQHQSFSKLLSGKSFQYQLKPVVATIQKQSRPSSHMSLDMTKFSSLLNKKTICATPMSKMKSLPVSTFGQKTMKTLNSEHKRVPRKTITISSVLASKPQPKVRKIIRPIEISI